MFYTIVLLQHSPTLHDCPNSHSCQDQQDRHLIFRLCRYPYVPTFSNFHDTCSLLQRHSSKLPRASDRISRQHSHHEVPNESHIMIMYTFLIASKLFLACNNKERMLCSFDTRTVYMIIIITALHGRERERGATSSCAHPTPMGSA